MTGSAVSSGAPAFALFFIGIQGTFDANGQVLLANGTVTRNVDQTLTFAPAANGIGYLRYKDT